MEKVDADEQREVYLKIRDPSRGDRLVTTVEVLSHANKARGSDSRELYFQKQREMLGSSVNFVEIDLLRAGLHATAVPKALAEAKAGHFDYHVCVHRGHHPWRDEVYPVTAKARLPRVGIPLLPEVPDVPADLQAVFSRCYEAGPYPQRIDYSRPPSPPLPHALGRWAEALLSAATHPGL